MDKHMQLMAGMHSSTSLVVAKWVSFNSAEDVEEASRQCPFIVRWLPG
jgi:hypothetical protein